MKQRTFGESETLANALDVVKVLTDDIDLSLTRNPLALDTRDARRKVDQLAVLLSRLEVPSAVSPGEYDLFKRRCRSPFAKRPVAMGAQIRSELSLLETALQRQQISVSATTQPPTPRKGRDPDKPPWAAIGTVIMVLAAMVTIAVVVPTIPPVRAWVLMSEAETLEASGEREIAELKAREANVALPGVPYFQRRAGFIFAQNQHWEDAVRYMCRSLMGDPSHVAALTELGVAYIGSRQFEEADRHLAAALIKEPNSAYALRNASIAKRYLRDYATSERYARQSLESWPTGVAWSSLAQTLAFENRWDELEALAAAELPAEIDPEEARSWAAIADVGRGRVDRVRDNFPVEYQRFYVWYAEIQFLTKRDDDVIRIYRLFERNRWEVPMGLALVSVSAFKRAGDEGMYQVLVRAIDNEAQVDAVMADPSSILGFTIEGQPGQIHGPLPTCDEVKRADKPFAVERPR